MKLVHSTPHSSPATSLMAIRDLSLARRGMIFQKVSLVAKHIRTAGNLTNHLNQAGNFVLSAGYDLHKMIRTSIPVDTGYLGTINMFHQLHCLVHLVSDPCMLVLTSHRTIFESMYIRIVSRSQKEHAH